MMVDALVAVNLRNSYYKEGARRMLAVVLVSLLTNALLIYALFYLINNPPAPDYFSVGVDGRISPIIPVDKPNQSDEEVLRWTSQAGLASFSYSYVNYRDELQASSGFFTGTGWDQFLTALKNSNNLTAVSDKKMVVSAQQISPATILRKEIINGSYTWRIDVPVLVTYQNVTEYTQQYDMVSILLVRVPTLNAPRGVGIEQLVASPISNEKKR